jgi:hypothetical protein
LGHRLAAAWCWLRPPIAPEDLDIARLRSVAGGAEAQLVGARLDGASVLLDCLTPARPYARTFTLRVGARESSGADIRAWLASDLWVGLMVLCEQGRRCVLVSDGVTSVVLPPRVPIG